jgi:hypothetical protein
MEHQKALTVGASAEDMIERWDGRLAQPKSDVTQNNNFSHSSATSCKSGPCCIRHPLLLEQLRWWYGAWLLRKRRESDRVEQNKEGTRVVVGD